MSDFTYMVWGLIINTFWRAVFVCCTVLGAWLMW